jgi:hypothetical protein
MSSRGRETSDVAIAAVATLVATGVSKPFRQTHKDREMNAHKSRLCRTLLVIWMSPDSYESIEENGLSQRPTVPWDGGVLRDDHVYVIISLISPVPQQLRLTT